MTIGIIFIIISAVVPLLLAWLGKSVIHNSDDVFTYPRPILYVGIIGVLSTALSITMVLVKEQFEYRFLPLLVFVGLIHIGSWYLVILQANWYFAFGEDAFTVRNIFRQKKTYRYSEISKIIMYYTSKNDFSQKMKIKIGEKSIMIESTMGGYPYFTKQLLKKAKKNDADFAIERVNRKI